MAAVMNIMSGLLSFFAEEKPPMPNEKKLALSKLREDKRYIRYLVINLVYGLSMAFAWPLFPFIVVDKLGMRIWQVATYSICSAAFAMGSQRYLGRLMDRIGRRPVVIFSRLSMVAAPLVYALAGDWTHILIAETLLGVGMGAWMSSGPTYIMDMAPPEMRATYIAANTALFGVSSFFGNLAGGYVTDNFLAAGSGFGGIQRGLFISSGLRLVTGLLYLLIYETHSTQGGVKSGTKEL
jgi:MFS family permease